MSGTNPPEGQPGPYGPAQQPYPEQPGQPFQPSPGYPTYVQPPYVQPQYTEPQYEPTAQYAPIPGYPPAPAPPQGGPPTGPTYGYLQQPAAPPPRKSAGAKIAIIIGSGVLALAVIVALVVYALRPAPRADNPTAQSTQPGAPISNPASQPPGSQPPSRPPAAPTPSDTVRTYLLALAAGDAAVALSLAVQAPAETTLLTSAVLAESNRHGGLSGISVPAVNDPGARAVRASYRIGKTQVSDVFAVAKVGEVWKLAAPYTWLDLSGTAYTRQPVLINRVPVKRDAVNVFPGTYVFTTGSGVADFGSANTVVVARTSRPPSTAGIKPHITSDGVGRMRSAARASLDACLKERRLAPKNCPFAATANGYRIDTSTIRWTRSGSDPFTKAKVIMDAGLIASTSVKLTIKGSVRCRSSSFTGTCTVTVRRTARALARLSSGSMHVIWTAN